MMSPGNKQRVIVSCARRICNINSHSPTKLVSSAEHTAKGLPRKSRHDRAVSCQSPVLDHIFEQSCPLQFCLFTFFVFIPSCLSIGLSLCWVPRKWTAGASQSAASLTPPLCPDRTAPGLPDHIHNSARTNADTIMRGAGIQQAKALADQHYNSAVHGHGCIARDREEKCEEDYFLTYFMSLSYIVLH